MVADFSRIKSDRQVKPRTCNRCEKAYFSRIKSDRQVKPQGVVYAYVVVF